MNNLCPTCQSALSAGDLFCLICGTQTEASGFRCPQCQSAVENDSKFCESCRAPLSFGETPTLITPRQFELPPSYLQNAAPASSSAATFSASGFPTPAIIGGVVLMLFLFLAAAFFLRASSADKTSSAQTFVSTSSTGSSSVSRQNTASLIGREGRLSTNLNIRSAPNKTALSIGIHFQNAKVKVLAVESYDTSEGLTNWYKVKILEYGCDAMGQLGCGKNNSSDSDEGWVNGKYVTLN